eukprot:5426638-Prymnesium_polylepis.1
MCGHAPLALWRHSGQCLSRLASVASLAAFRTCVSTSSPLGCRPSRSALPACRPAPTRSGSVAATMTTTSTISTTCSTTRRT